MSRILLVEDTLVFVEILSGTFAEMGHQVVVRHDGLEALQLILEEPPDVAVVDYFLPKIDGGRLARYIRRLDPNRRISVVILSGAVESMPPEDLDVADAVVAKSKPETLSENLRNVLDTLADPERAGELIGKPVGLEGLAPRTMNRKIHELNYHRTSLYEALGEAVLETDAEGVVVNLNSKAVSLLDMAEVNIVGQHVLDALRLQAESPLSLALQENLRGSSDIRRQVPWQLNDRVLQCTVTQIPMMDAKPHLLLIGEDITDRTRAEDSARVLKAGIAHDINNVLTIVAGLATVMRDESNADDPRRADLGRIVTAAARGAELTRSLLDFARRTVSNKERLQLNSAVETVAQMICRTDPSRVVVQTDLCEDLPPVLADPGQLNDALTNICLNAVHALGGAGTLRIATACGGSASDKLATSENTGVLVTVTDSGCGMDEATRRQAFDPFFTTKGSGGVGLGLATVRGVIEAHGGTVDIDSAIGRGTTVTLWMPAARRP